MLKEKLTLIFFVLALASNAGASGAEAYLRHCASCHHHERYGLSGPPLIPEYFGSRQPAELYSIISGGLKATNMPGFKDMLTADEIKEIVSYITTPAKPPEWGISEMLSTLRLRSFEGQDRKTPYDMADFFMVVEAGAGRVHFMEGGGFKVLDSIRAGAIHGGPKFDKDLRYAYIASRDGWVIKYDLRNLFEAGRIRAGVSLRNIAVSSDSRYLAVATLLPESLVFIDTLTMKPVKAVTGEGAFGSVYNLKGRKEFIAAMRDNAELMVIKEGSFEAKKLTVDQPFTDFFIDPEERFIAGTSRKGGHVSIFDLDKGLVVEKVGTEARMPHLASAAIWKDGGRTFAVFPNIGKPLVSVMELYSWKMVKEIGVKGPGFFARTHENVAHIWVDTGTDTVQLIDKKTLEVTGELMPEKGKKAMHIEFTKDGSMALVSVWEDDGAVKVYTTKGLALVKSMPFRKPAGKYNATNKK